jgi:hypothetical protein
MPQFVQMQGAMYVRKTVVSQGTYMLAPRSYRLLVSALTFALLASIAPNARAANPPDDLAKFLFLTQLGDMPDNAVVCPSFALKPISAALLQSLQVADNRFVRVEECVKVMDVRIGSYHRPSGRHAYFFSIHDFRMLADGRAVAKIDQYFNGKWATYETVEVRESAGQWSLVRIFDRWQS